MEGAVLCWSLGSVLGPFCPSSLELVLSGPSLWVILLSFHSALVQMHSECLLTMSTGRQPARVTVSGRKWEEGSRRVQGRVEDVEGDGRRGSRLRGPGRASVGSAVCGRCR